MSVCIIAEDDAKALTNKLRTSLQSATNHIETISFDGFLKSKSTQNEKTVNVLFLTTLTWQEIQRQGNDVKRLFSKSMDTVVLSSCTTAVRSAAVEMLSKTVDDWDSVGLFEASGADWYNAEARIKYRLSELESGEFHIPCASRYIIKPDSVSTQSEAKSEVLVILFDDGTDEHPSNVKKVDVKVSETLIEAKKIQSNVWSFSAKDLGIGEYEIRVLVDRVDIGPTILNVKNQHFVVRELLANFKRDDPEGFLAELLMVNREDFDRDLLDTISGSSCVSLVETLLKYGDENGSEYPNFLHFCAKNGYSECVDWCQRTLCDFKEACMVQNRHGQTPEQVATEAQQNQLLIQTLQNKGTGDEDLQPIGSPFNPERFIFGTTRRNRTCPELHYSRDSGWSSQCSGDSSDSSMTIQENSASSGNSVRYRFRTQTRPYNTIEDGDDNVDPYNRPWDGKTLLANRSAQALSAGTLPTGLSGSVREDGKDKKKGLMRSNTTGSSGTKL